MVFRLSNSRLLQDVSYGAFTQLGDRFILLGGECMRKYSVKHASNFIYEYDISNERFLKRPETLSLATAMPAAVLVGQYYNLV